MVKSDQGYLKNSNSEAPVCVPLEKASVFNTLSHENINVLVDSGKKAGLTNIRLVELLITEKELG
ncbi:hypothetical protein [Desulforamulus reducens]|uniref:hypothetical protein n=1 Tax=Desulforamulus reducens TaxID=59610 RepID=UPI0018DD7473|nr:hypothetical protein [Desulforamulus reducens]